MRRIRYSVACSLDGYIAGPKGEADWITMDPEIDFNAIFSEFDTLLIGRKTFEAMGKYGGGGGGMPGVKSIILSRTMRPADYPKLTIFGDNSERQIAGLKEQPGKDIWLFGGGELFRSLLEAGLVDSVEVGVMPVLLGGGIPLLPAPARQAKLKLIKQTVYKTSGIIGLEYAVEKPAVKDAGPSRRERDDEDLERSHDRNVPGGRPTGLLSRRCHGVQRADQERVAHDRRMHPRGIHRHRPGRDE